MLLASHDPQRLGRYPRLRFDAFDRHQPFSLGRRLPHQLVQVTARVGQLNFAALQLVERHQILDAVAQSLGVGDDGRHVLADSGIGLGRQPHVEQLRIPLDDGQRRAQVVGGHRQQARLTVAVSAHDADPVALVDPEGHRLEDLGGRVFEAKGFRAE